MRILLTNDDGIFAPGLAALHKTLQSMGRVTVVAPMDCRSGTSHSITFSEPLTCNRICVSDNLCGFGVYGSPADCVKLACMQLHDGPIDLVVAGINHGANVGINVFYSGTVAAAMEAAFLQIPAAAISLACEEYMDFATAAEYGVKALAHGLPIQPGDVFNINIPRLSAGRPKGVAVAPQSTNGFHEYYVPQKDGDDRAVFQLSSGNPRPETQGTDTMRLSEGYITVTPLRADITCHQRIGPLGRKYEGFVFDG